MALWQRRHDHSEAVLDGHMKASRERFIAEHDATFDFESGWAEIVARTGATTQLTPQLEPMVRRPDDEHADEVVPTVVDPRRRPGRRRVLAGAGTIAAAAAVAAAIAVSGVGRDGETDLEMAIVAATRSALADSIEYQVVDWTDTPPTMDDEFWRDQTTAAVRHVHYAEDGSGQHGDWGPVTAPTPADAGPPTGPRPHLRVDHCFGEYAIEDLEEATSTTNASIAHWVAESLDVGRLRTDGTEVVDGDELIRVVAVDDPETNIWYVDPQTYRPVRLLEDNGGVMTTIEYLPRTPELLAQFTPVIPEGYVQVDELTAFQEPWPCS